MSEIRQRPLEATIAPCRILPRHPDRQRTNLLQDTRPTDPPSDGRPLARDQPPVPAEDGMPRRREPAALGIREVEALPAQVLFEDAVLFPQGGDHLELPAIHPSREGDDDLRRHRLSRG